MVKCGCLHPVNFGKGEEQKGISAKEALERVFPKQKSEPKFKEGQWVRNYLGELRQIYRLWEPENQLIKAVSLLGPFTKEEDALETINAKDLKLALPRKGEWWQLNVCAKHRVFGDAPEKAHNDGSQGWAHPNRADDMRLWTECGCMVPVNFGRGEE